MPRPSKRATKQRSRWPCSVRRPAAFLVFLAGATDARIIPPHLRAVATHRLRLGDGVAAVAHHDRHRAALLLETLDGLLARELHGAELLVHVALDPPHHGLEHVEALFLVLLKRVHL